MTQIEAEIDAKIFYIALKAVSQTLDEVNVAFTPEGMHVREMDMGEVSMVDLFIPRGMFEVYRLFEGDKHVLTVRMSDLVGGGYNKRAGPFKRPKKDDRATVRHKEDENMLTLMLKGNSTSTLKVPVLKSDERKELPLPKVNLTETFSATTKVIGEFLNGARSVADSVWIVPQPNGNVVLEVKGEVSTAALELSLDDGTLVDSDLRNSVKMSYDLGRLLKLFQRDLGETVQVAYAKELPLMITYALNAGDLYREKGQVMYYVAPRVERDYEPAVEPEKQAEEAPTPAPEVIEVAPVTQEKPEEEEPKVEVVAVVDPLAAFKQRYRKPTPF